MIKREWVIPTEYIARNRKDFTFCTIPKWANWAIVDRRGHVVRYQKRLNPKAVQS